MGIIPDIINHSPERSANLTIDSLTYPTDNELFVSSDLPGTETEEWLFPVTVSAPLTAILEVTLASTSSYISIEPLFFVLGVSGMIIDNEGIFTWPYIGSGVDSIDLSAYTGKSHFVSAPLDASISALYLDDVPYLFLSATLFSSAEAATATKPNQIEAILPDLTDFSDQSCGGAGMDVIIGVAILSEAIIIGTEDYGVIMFYDETKSLVSKPDVCSTKVFNGFSIHPTNSYSAPQPILFESKSTVNSATQYNVAGCISQALNADSSKVDVTSCSSETIKNYDALGDATASDEAQLAGPILDSDGFTVTDRFDDDGSISGTMRVVSAVAPQWFHTAKIVSICEDDNGYRVYTLLWDKDAETTEWDLAFTFPWDLPTPSDTHIFANDTSVIVPFSTPAETLAEKGADVTKPFTILGIFTTLSPTQILYLVTDSCVLVSDSYGYSWRVQMCIDDEIIDAIASSSDSLVILANSGERYRVFPKAHTQGVSTNYSIDLDTSVTSLIAMPNNDYRIVSISKGSGDIHDLLSVSDGLNKEDYVLMSYLGGDCEITSVEHHFEVTSSITRIKHPYSYASGSLIEDDSLPRRIVLDKNESFSFTVVLSTASAQQEVPHISVLSHDPEFIDVTVSMSSELIAIGKQYIYEVTITECSDLDLLLGSGEDMFATSVTIGIDKACFSYYYIEDNYTEFLSMFTIPVIIGCPSSLALEFDAETSGEKYPASLPEEGIPSFAFEDDFYPVFNIVDSVVGTYELYTGNYTFTIIGSGSYEDTVELFSDDDRTQINQATFSPLDNSVTMNSDNRLVFNYDTCSIGWACLNGSTCYNTIPRKMGESPALILRVFVETNDGESYCKLSQTFDIRLYGTRFEFVWAGSFAGGTLAILCIIVVIAGIISYHKSQRTKAIPDGFVRRVDKNNKEQNVQVIISK
ncbi:Cation channel sperm-associated protein, subunit gamma like protein [Aduncisulcus paluster]|uniref:Cation channel sperm-associated protein, subunit gamma like protein n=1 Tax=Aduncisulcus paluster TaxID=2918883 RepID=A0ABQ5KWX5_9EUKA|nr:Cation channel sperm-associated protein, subunit gamma like protein [Aduncisulcus paluster]